MLGEQSREVAQLDVASDQRRQRFGDRRARARRAAIAPRTGDGRRVERTVLGEDRRLQLPELVTRFEPELLAEDVTTLLEDAQRVGLPAGPVQREHQQAPEPLAQRMRGDELLELDDRTLVTTELRARGRAAPRSRRGAAPTTG